MNKDQLDYSSYMRWKSNEFTLMYRQSIEDAKAAALDVLVHVHMDDLVLMGKYLGKIQVLSDLLAIDYADLTGRDELGN